MRVLSFKDKLFIVLPFTFQLLTDFDYSLLDHFWFQMSQQPSFCFSWVKVPLIHIMRRIYEFPLYIFKHIKGHSPCGVPQTCDSLWDGKKQKILCVSTVGKACFLCTVLLRCSEQCQVFSHLWLCVSGVFCSVIQNSHPPGTTACIYPLFQGFQAWLRGFSK